ncbi:FAD-dependent oxidoreductase [Sphingomonas baiyangensis]|uniref:FAD-dependent oxidoreductase n=1 Tax=Sphingomonas baiyangensis TaxID=2572576 RepID=A0A4U1L7H0_9SPHN|nr:FAD-dependent oxidoreductase [Sphingomonas baiyangensis]TKD52897.1 FAD-dependent oxidoreductase [Sphingomonas baiyangensis]
MKADRRTLLGLATGAAVLGGTGAALAFGEKPLPPGALMGADLARGHRLGRGGFPPPSREEQVPVVIAGGGIAGLSAGWTLAGAGFDDFRLLELEDWVGGNARARRNATSAYPLGAHYLPVANAEAADLRALLAELGIITGEADGRPVYDPTQLCADLQERIFWRGRWQEGLIPATGLSSRDRSDLDRFAAAMTAFSAAIGSDGKPAFATPIAYSSTDAAWRDLDRVSFADWLDAQNYASPLLRAHVRYGMRDDYGSEPRDVSAWAGIHYFAGRRGLAANGAGDNVLTWPEGNARLANAMAARLGDRIAGGRIVHRVARTDTGVAVDHFNVASGTTTRTHARAVVLAMPLFVATRICAELGDARACSYAPWLVANVTVDRMPEGAGVPLAWDNVSTTSDSLGYVVATHQSRSVPGESVLTWYMPLSDMAPASARRLLIERPAADWKRVVRDDLLAMHPELDGMLRHIELWRWGHAMIRPTPGYVWGAARTFAPASPLFLAHSDLSGMSLFEEAHWHGVQAARGAMAHLGHTA